MKTTRNITQRPRQAGPPRWVYAAGAIPLMIVALLYLGGVPYGRPGLQVYPYSRLVGLRFLAALPVLIAAGILAFGRTGRNGGPSREAPGRSSPRGGPATGARTTDKAGAAGGGRSASTWAGAVTMLAAAGLGVWTHLAPPVAAQQHFFNLSSPSHEGAFLHEADTAGSVGEYLSGFSARLRLTPAELRGTRVLSNPPGVTMLAMGVDRLLRAMPALGELLAAAHLAEDLTDAAMRRAFIRAVAVAWVFTACWVAAAAFLFRTASLWLTPWGAAALTLMCFFTPSAACFSPGKDPAQLLTVSMMMWGWLRSVERGSGWSALLGGVACGVGLMFGLIHAWVAVILVVASVVGGTKGAAGVRRWFVRSVGPALAGLALVGAGCWLLWRWNLPVALVEVARRYRQVQDLIARWPWYWQAAKLPAFLLFAGGGLWMLAALNIRRVRRDDPAQRASDMDRPARQGLVLLVVTLVVAAFTAVQTTLETPRLQVVFVPLLGLGLALRVPELRAGQSCGGRLLRGLVALLLLTTALQWCLFDARESEMRILTGRFFE